jgi:hypothetical protein
LVEHRMELIAIRQPAVAARVDRHVHSVATAASGTRDRAARSRACGEALAGGSAAGRLEIAAEAAVRAVRVRNARPRTSRVHRRRALAGIAPVLVFEHAVGALRSAAESGARWTRIARARGKPPVALAVRLARAKSGADARSAGAQFRQCGRREPRAIGGRAAARRAGAASCVGAAAVGHFGCAGCDGPAATFTGGAREKQSGKHGGLVRTTATQATLHHVLILHPQELGAHRMQCADHAVGDREGRSVESAGFPAESPLAKCANPGGMIRVISRTRAGQARARERERRQDAKRDLGWVWQARCPPHPWYRSILA